YKFSIDGIMYQNFDKFNSLKAGEYICSIKDKNSCTWNKTITLSEPSSKVSLKIKSQKQASCAGLNDAVINVNANGGTAPYKFKLNNNPLKTDSSFKGIAAGKYTVKVYDTNGCEDSKTVIITEPDSLSISFITKNI